MITRASISKQIKRPPAKPKKKKRGKKK